MWCTVDIVETLNPKFVIWENVKNLLSKKHVHNFNAYLEMMDKLGYNSYFQVLNAKDFGVPQNRERVYTVSIRKDIDNGSFKFPDKEELKLRLKDILEDDVDEKYYLNDDKIQKIARWNSYQKPLEKVLGKNSISPTLTARGAGEEHSGMITFSEKLEDTTNLQTKILNEPKCLRIGGMYGQTTRWGLYDDKGIAPTLVAAMGEGGGYIPMVENRAEPIILNDENTEIKEETFVGKKYNNFIDKNGYIPQLFNPYNESEIKDIAPTQTSNCGSTTSSSTVLKVEEIKLSGAYGRNFGSRGKMQDTNDICDTLVAAMGTGGGNVPIIKELPQIIVHNIPQKVYVRKYPIDKEKLKQILRESKVDCDVNNEWLKKQLNVPITTVEHWFRKDDSFSIPSPEVWFKLKELLKIETNEFDESIMTFVEKDGVYDKANRVYDEKGIAPTLTQQEEKILTGATGEPKIITVGNYSPSNHDASRIVDEKGIAPTVKENHGTVTAVARTIIDAPYIVASRGRNINGINNKTEQRLEPNSKGLCNTLTSVQKDNLIVVLNKNAKHQQDLVQSKNDICRTIPAGTHGSTPHLLKTIIDEHPLRIRKLTPKECWRLMRIHRRGHRKMYFSRNI